jgi:cytidine deaminase
VTDGYTKIEAIAIAGEKKKPIPPCGICRQFISEFGLDIVIYMETKDGIVSRWNARNMIPGCFISSDMDESA